MNKNIGIYVAIGILAIISLAGLFKPIQVVVQSPLGASTDETNIKNFLNTVTISGKTVLSGDVRVLSPVTTGASTTITASPATTTAITAAVACDKSLANVTPSITAASILTLPTAELMFADCLTTNGDEVTLYVRNLNSSTTVITAGSASTTIAIDNGGTVTLGALGSAKITFVRLANNLMWAFVSVFKP